MTAFLILALCSVVGCFATGLTVGIVCERRRIRDNHPDLASTVLPPTLLGASIPTPRAPEPAAGPRRRPAKATPAAGS